MKILFVTPYIPYPPEADGTKLIIWNVAKQLAKKHELILVAFGEPSEVESSPLRDVFRQVHFVELQQSLTSRALSFGRSVATKLPYSVEKFQKRQMVDVLSHVLLSTTVDVVHVETYALAHYVDIIHSTRCIASVHDSRSLTLAEEIRHAKKSPAMTGFLRRELALMQKYEATVYSKFDASVVVSEHDKNYLLSLNNATNIVVINNGVASADGEWKPPSEQLGIVFTGDLGYFPNEDAVIFFTREILPRVRERIPDAQFFVVGRNPSKSIMDLAAHNVSVIVTGEVPSIREYVERCAVSVAPIRYGSGVKNKILDALAVGRPVVALESACSGLARGFEEFVRRSTSAEAFAGHVIDILLTPSLVETIGRRARDFVRTEHSWERTAVAYERVYTGETS